MNVESARVQRRDSKSNKMCKSQIILKKKISHYLGKTKSQIAPFRTRHAHVLMCS